MHFPAPHDTPRPAGPSKPQPRQAGTPPPQLQLAALRSEFCDHRAEQAFQRHHLATTRAQLRVTFLFCSFFYLAFAITDVVSMGYSGHSALLVGTRLAVVAVGLGSLLLLRLYPRSLPLTRLVASATEAAGSAGFLLIAAMRPTEFLLHAIAMTIIIVVLYIYVPNRLLYALGVALPATAGFIALAAQRGQLGRVELGTMATLLVLANIFGYVAARRYQLLWREEYRAQTVLKNLSVRDPLTGCYNRRHLHEQLLETEVSRARRYGLSLTVIMCDLDHFKSVNDRYGHHGGDVVLQAFAGLLQSMTRDTVDSVVRYGGEEFLLILPETDLAGGVLLAERLRQTLEATPVPLGEQTIRATASFGVASMRFAAAAGAGHGGHAGMDGQAGQDGHGEHGQGGPGGMIACADALLYAAKDGGRNRVCSRQL